MRMIIFSLIVAVSMAYSIAQDSIFDKCYNADMRFHVTRDYVQLSMPQGFKELTSDEAHLLFINKDYMPLDAFSTEDRAIYFAHVIIESEAKDCVFLYPQVELSLSMNRNPAVRELQIAAEDEESDVSDKIHKISQKDMSMYSNADTVFIYKMELPQPHLGRYTHCTGVVLKKYAHPNIVAKMILSDAGLLNEEKYLQMLLDSISYSNTITDDGIQAEKEAEYQRRDHRKHGPCIHISQARESNKALKEAEKRLRSE